MRFVALSAALLFGCAQMVWTKPGSTEREFNADSGRCKYSSLAANPSEYQLGKDPGAVGFQEPGRAAVTLAGTAGQTAGDAIAKAAGGDRESQMYQACMQSLGWQLVPR